MSILVDIEKKQKSNYNIKIGKPQDIFQLNEIKEIRDAVQEHLFLIGLDRRNNIRCFDLVGIGSSAYINVDGKDIVRKALISASNKVLLVHNHPSNSIEPSLEDKKITEKVKSMLDFFEIELIDHIIVAENDYCSMMSIEKNRQNNAQEELE